jgi:uncharacterized protein YybS (DUF2232 family)
LKTFGMLFSSNPFYRMLLILTFFVSAAAFVPAVGSIFLIFLPLLTLFYSAVAGKVKTASAFLIPVLLVFLISHLLQLNTPYLVILTMGIVGLAINVFALKNNSIEKTVIYPALIIIGAICAFFLYSGFTLSISPWKLVQQFVDQAIEQNMNLYAQLPLEKEDITLMRSSKTMFVSFFTGIFPALTIIGSLTLVWINVLMGRDILRKAAIILPQLEGLSGWKAPEFIIWIFIISGGLLMLPDEQFRFFSLNIFILTGFIYLLQGLAILSFFFQNKNVPVFFRYIFYFLIAVQQFLVIPIAIAGLFDIWVDFRRFFRKNQAAT